MWTACGFLRVYHNVMLPDVHSSVFQCFCQMFHDERDDPWNHITKMSGITWNMIWTKMSNWSTTLKHLSFVVYVQSAGDAVEWGIFHCWCLLLDNKHLKRMLFWAPRGIGYKSFLLSRLVDASNWFGVHIFRSSVSMEMRLIPATGFSGIRSQFLAQKNAFVLNNSGVFLEIN